MPKQKFGEPTRTYMVRIPISRYDELKMAINNYVMDYVNGLVVEPVQLLIRLLGETEQKWDILTEDERKLLLNFLKDYERKS